MATTKSTRAARKPRTTTGNENSIVKETKQVAISTLQMYYKNPRIGDVDAIAISLEENGQFKPIVVNIGTKTGRKDEILAGNQTYLAARKEITYRDADGGIVTKKPWKHLLASFVDVNEEEAKKIVLADNRIGQLGGFDEKILADLLQDTSDIVGTGYKQQDVEDILKGMDLDSVSMKSIDEFLGEMPDALPGEEEEHRSERQRVMDDEDDDRREVARARGAARPTEESEEDKDIEEVDANAELQVVLELKEAEFWKGTNDWQVPDLRPDMLLDELPGPLTTWGGDEATPDDGKKWFLYQYGLGGRRGLPIDRSIMCFATHDSKFMGWWETPAYYTTKYITLGLKYAVVPDFSFYTPEPQVMHLVSQFRGQWLGRFFQEAGLKIIPRIQFDYYNEKTLDICTLGTPKGTPILFSSMQNFDGDDAMLSAAKTMRKALEKIEPGRLLLYGAPKRMARFWEMTGYDCEVDIIENYVGVRRSLVFDKKEGAKKLTKKQKAKIIEKHGGAKDRSYMDFDPDAEGDNGE